MFGAHFGRPRFDLVIAHLDGRLARYKIPQSVLVVGELPHNASGKLLKARVKEEHG